MNLTTLPYSSLITHRSFYPFQRPLPVDEFEVEARDAVGAGARGADGGDDREAGLRARQTHEPAAVDLERRPDGGAAPADVLRHRLLAGRHPALAVEDLEPDAHRHLEPRQVGARAGRRAVGLAHPPHVVLRRDRVNL